MTEFDPEKLALWKARIEEQRASGLTQAEYCRRNNCKERQFSFWKGMIFPGEKLAAGTTTRRRRRAKSDTYSPYEQKRLFQKWKRGGLTQAEFCRRENIFQWQLSEWKRRVEREAKQSAATKIPRKKRAKKNNFVEVKAENEYPIQDSVSANIGSTTSSSRIVAQIHFSGGSIFIYSDAEVADVRKIVTALAECANDRTK